MLDITQESCYRQNCRIRRHLSAEDNHHDIRSALERGDAPERILVGERFMLFPSHRSRVQWAPPGDLHADAPRLHSRVLLHTDLLPPVPVDLDTVATWKDRSQAFAPFTPELGYHVTAEDFDPVRREEKLAAMLAAGTRDIPGNPLEIAAGIPREAVIRLGLQAPYPTQEWTGYTADASDVLATLRFQLFFPNGMRLEARSEGSQFGARDVFFMDGFYPFDTGPLRVPTGYRHLIGAGLQVAVPADPTLLAQIEGRFVLR